MTGLAVAGVHCLLWWLYYWPAPKVLWGDESRYLEAAQRLLAGDPGWRPGLLWPPLYPRFVAGVMAVSGNTLVGLQVAQTLLVVLAAVLLGDLARRLGGSRTAGLVAAALTLGFPPLVAFAHFLWPEVLHLALFLAVLWILVAKPTSTPWVAVAGVAIGLCALTKSLLLPFVPVMLIAAVVAPGFAVGVASRAAALLLAMVLTVSPTLVSNWHRDRVLAIADSSAFNLWVGLNETSHRPFTIDAAGNQYEDFVHSAPTFAGRNQVLRGKIRQHFRDNPLLGVLSAQLSRQYFLLFDKDSYLTEQLPAGAAFRQGCGYLQAAPAVSVVLRSLCYASYGLLLAAAPFGLAGWRFRERRWLLVLLLFVGYNLALFFWLHATTRYQVQLLPVLFLGAGHAAAWLAAPERAAVRGLGPVGWATCTGVSALLLFFAFAGPFL